MGFKQVQTVQSPKTKGEIEKSDTPDEVKAERKCSSKISHRSLETGTAVNQFRKDTCEHHRVDAFITMNILYRLRKFRFNFNVKNVYA